ncbi:MAG: hypothetical protein QUS09_03960, partial [Methanotrichaceae archaeon]|nr:hypothetical protein [Methanotrichaceae archaeon]
MKKTTLMICILCLILCLAGCNAYESAADDSSDEADIEDAQEALDDGDYDGAISILAPEYNASNPDPVATRILASAYMGKAGVDLTNILESSGDDTRDNFDVISSALSFDITNNAAAEEATSKAFSQTTALYITQSSVATFLTYLAQAQTYLNAMVAAYNDDDDRVQLGMVSAVHFILKVGYEVSVVTETNVPINKKAFQEALPNDGNLTTHINKFRERI